MNPDTYLNFLYKTVSKDMLVEKSSIAKFHLNIEIPEKNTKKNDINTKLVIIKIPLENKKILLVEDLPENFLLGLTILLGNKTSLVEFELKEEPKIKYISTKDILQKINTKINLQTLIKIEPKEIMLKKYSFEFTQPKIIFDLKQYISKIKNMNLNKIHIIESSSLENFIPTIKKKHFKIAMKMNLPLINLIKHNFIKDSNINIYDTSMQVKILKPIITSNIKIKWDFKKNTDEKLYKDFKKELYLNFNKKELIEKIQKSTKTNVEKEKLIEIIRKSKPIELSNNIGNIPLPLWKNIKTQKYLNIKNTQDFFNLSGVKFELNQSFLKNIYLQNEQGNKCTYKDKFLNPALEKIFENISENSNIIYENIQELILKLTYNDNVEEIIKLEKLNPRQINQLKNTIKKLCRKTISESVKQNKIPEEKKPVELLEKYFLSIATSLKKEHEKFQDVPSKNTLLINTLKITCKLLQTINTQKTEFNNTYFLNQIILSLLTILEKLEKTSAIELKTLFESYFKKNQQTSHFLFKNEKLEKLINSIIMANKIANKKPTCIIIKKETDVILLSSKIQILTQIPISKKILKINIDKLKQTFPYSYKDIVAQVKYINIQDSKVNQPKSLQIKLKDRQIILDESYFQLFEKYEKYKQIIDNPYFKLLVKRS